MKNALTNEKHHAASNKKGVVGNTGKITHLMANPTHNQPAIISNTRFMLCFQPAFQPALLRYFIDQIKRSSFSTTILNIRLIYALVC